MGTRRASGFCALRTRAARRPRYGRRWCQMVWQQRYSSSWRCPVSRMAVVLLALV